jgi:hypothetical protein
MLHASNQVSPSSVASESIRQFTSRVAELRESDNVGGGPNR